MSAKKALDQGVIDAISENSLIEDAILFLQDKIGLDEHPKVRDKNDKVIEARGDDNILAEARALAAKTRRGNLLLGRLLLVLKLQLMRIILMTA